MNWLRRLLHHIDPTGGCQRCGLRWTQKVVYKGLRPSVWLTPSFVERMVMYVPVTPKGEEFVRNGYRYGVHALCANCMAELPRKEWLPYFEKQCREQYKNEMLPELREAILHGSDIG